VSARSTVRRKDVGVRFSDVHDDAETAEAARALERVLRDRNLDRAQRGLDERLAQPPEWRAVLGSSDFTLYVTPDELRELDGEIVAILRRFEDRVADATRRPPGSRPVELLLMAYAHRPGDA
jgi:hypothetical protein